jgi:hypothetical protein
MIISTDRPPGRQTFTAAHELGHHIFGHGTRSDEYFETPRSDRAFEPEECLADSFAAHLLMPPAAIREAFAIRRTTPKSASPEHIYSISTWLGVGYDTLIWHMEVALQMISPDDAYRLRMSTPKALRISIVGDNKAPHLVIADQHWMDRTIDLRIGDGVLLPEDCIEEGSRLRLINRVANRQYAVAVTRGIGRVESRSMKWSSFVRVMPAQYEGLGYFRFDEDPDEKENTGFSQ